MFMVQRAQPREASGYWRNACPFSLLGKTMEEGGSCFLMEATKVWLGQLRLVGRGKQTEKKTNTCWANMLGREGASSVLT